MDISLQEIKMKMLGLAYFKTSHYSGKYMVVTLTRADTGRHLFHSAMLLPDNELDFVLEDLIRRYVCESATSA